VLDLEVRQESGQREDLVPDAVHVMKRKDRPRASVTRSTSLLYNETATIEDRGRAHRLCDSLWMKCLHNDSRSDVLVGSMGEG
jgi:hypothetical protein